jgi:hypothetical protein
MNILAPRRNICAGQFGLCFAAALLLLAGAAATRAQVVIVPEKPVIGSSNPVSATPPVAVPDTKPCTVTLFQDLEFADFNNKNFSYTPPSGCPGPWAKVVFTADFTVTEGTQFDRTGSFFLGGANIFFGTTAEPGTAFSPSWHVERDVTDLSSVFTTAQAGTAILGNFVGISNGVDYNGIIYANAHLIFYPATWRAPAPMTPSVVVGMPGNSGAAALNTSSSVYSQTVTLPTNVVGAYLDVFAQGQSADEFWYTCVPNALSSELESCGSTGFRETEITVDGKPAGVAPVYPWIFTGGIDPFLWQPLPGVQTLNFVPYRVDLTPFAGPLSDGNTHTVGIQVYNADSYFQVVGNLLVYTDPFRKQVTGELETNTLTAEPDPDITNTITTSSTGVTTGAVKTVSNRKFTIAGYVNTSLGKVRTTVNQSVDFQQTETFNVSSTQDKQDIVQLTKVEGDTETSIGGFAVHKLSSFSYPFTLGYNFQVNADGSASQTTQTSQGDQVSVSGLSAWLGGDALQLSNTVVSQDTLNFDASGNFTGNTANKSSADYVSTDERGGCYSEKLTSANGALTGVSSGGGCHPW